MFDHTALYNLPDPALGFRWIAIMPFTNGPMAMHVESIQATFTKVAARPRFSGGAFKYFPESANIDGLAINVYESSRHPAAKWFLDWHAKVYDNSTGFYGLPKDYKRDVILNLFPVNGNEPSFTVTYKDCWPTDRVPVDLNYQDETSRVVLSIQLSVDDIFIGEQASSISAINGVAPTGNAVIDIPTADKTSSLKFLNSGNAGFLNLASVVGSASQRIG